MSSIVTIRTDEPCAGTAERSLFVATSDLSQVLDNNGRE